jgi:galactose mutarotase-like enzyme
VRDVVHEREGERDVARATYDAGDFGGHWPSRTRLDFEYALSARRFEVVVRATNVGDETLPMGIGSHPYFRIPSGDRAQARLHVPARLRALVNDYDAVLPTGALEAVAGTAYDFTAAAGRALGDQYLDDCFTGLERDANGAVVCDVVDPAARYQLRVVGTSPAIRAVQVYAPPSEAYVALEPQFNLADPFGAEWPAGTDTGMVMLAPGAAAEYRVALEIDRP